MHLFEQILVKHWGYTHFRPLQREIIESVVSGNDALGLMPTGGGKSIIFQVASLAQDGLCIVVTPLIALMKDQVDNLRDRKIKAVAVYSGMSYEEIMDAFNKCQWGDYKFLYVSPERLKTELFQSMVQKLKVNLVTVDEAHCISRWGYDFRPSYLEIARLRELLPGIPVLALTATATPSVAGDIMERLAFKQKNLFSTSFERKNLTYLAREKDDKLGHLLTIATKTGGVGIVYVRNRQKTQEVALFLRNKGVNADFYHAGLPPEVRTHKQNQWKASKDMVMVCTNAFGMGIDKPDVRFVVHLDLPESPEDYFQEAGRAGRDEKPAWAVLLYNRADVEKLRRNIEVSFPEIDTIKRTYEALAHYYHIPVGDAIGNVYDFVLSDFCQKFKLEVLPTHNALKVLEQEGFIEFSESVEFFSKLKFSIVRDDLYKLQVANRDLDIFIKLILRTYTGLFTDYVRIDEYKLAAVAKTNVEVIKKFLVKLNNDRVVHYIPPRKNPLIIFTSDRVDPDSMTINKKEYLARKERSVVRVEAMIQYATSTTKCRSISLLEYFGEEDVVRCGNCDVCRNRNELEMSSLTFDNVLKDVKNTLAQKQMPLHELMLSTHHPEEQVLKVIQFLFDNKKVVETPEGRLKWHE